MPTMGNRGLSPVPEIGACPLFLFRKTAYIKVTIQAGVTVIQFKEK